MISSILDLKSLVLSAFADNNSGAITPQILREFLESLLDTMSPAYGVVALASQPMSLSAVPVPVAPFTTNVTDTSDYFTNTLLTGKIARELGGAPGSRIMVNASGSIAGPNNRDITVRLYKNGSPTGFSQTISTSGPANRVSFNLVGIDLISSDATYELRASAPTSSAVVFHDVLFMVQAQPVRAFV